MADATAQREPLLPAQPAAAHDALHDALQPDKPRTGPPSVFTRTAAKVRDAMLGVFVHALRASGGGHSHASRHDGNMAMTPSGVAACMFAYVLLPAALLTCFVPGFLFSLPPLTRNQCLAAGISPSDDARLAQCTRTRGYNGGRWTASSIIVHGILVAFAYMLVLIPIQRLLCRAAGL